MLPKWTPFPKTLLAFYWSRRSRWIKTRAWLFWLVVLVRSQSSSIQEVDVRVFNVVASNPGPHHFDPSARPSWRGRLLRWASWLFTSHSSKSYNFFIDEWFCWKLSGIQIYTLMVERTPQGPSKTDQKIIFLAPQATKNSDEAHKNLGQFSHSPLHSTDCCRSSESYIRPVLAHLPTNTKR